MLRHDFYALCMVALGGGAIYAFYRWEQARAATATADATGNGLYTSEILTDASGVNLAVDIGSGGVLDTVPTGETIDPYTDSLSVGVDPTTGEVGIANTQNITGDYTPSLTLVPALNQSQLEALDLEN